jgi:DNA-binding response OmpR family regulator
MLQLLEFQVEVFPEARAAARALLAGRRPNVIILDINMPEVSGIDFLEFVRQRQDKKSLPIVMLSSETTDIQVDQAMTLGANAFVFKPVTIEELQDALRTALTGA